MEPKELPSMYNSPTANCINWATWNFSENPVLFLKTQIFIFWFDCKTLSDCRGRGLGAGA